MPLITNTLPARENEESFQDASIHVQQKDEVREEKDKGSGYDDFEDFDECLDSDMEGSILHRPRPKKRVQVPALPARSEKRTSKILESGMKELQSLDGTEEKADTMSMLQESDPHELYLSSEEDASLSDDYEDSDSLVDEEEVSEATEESRESTSRSSRRKSQEDTARVVSFMVVGKPQIVDIFIPSNHTSPVDSLPSTRHSMNLDALSALTKAPSAPKTSSSKPNTRRPTPLKLYPSSIRRMSISSTFSSYTNSSNYSMPTNASMTNLSTISSSQSTGITNHPPRKSSRLALNMASIVTSLSNKSNKGNNTFSASTFSGSSTHCFLDSDPYAQQTTHNLPSPTEISTPLTPKTPTSAAQWAKGFGRSLSKARKPSMPKVSLAYANPASLSPANPNHRASTSHSNRSSSLAHIPTTPDEKKRQSVFNVEESGVKRSETAPVVQSPKEGPVRYEDIMRTVIRAPPPIPLSASNTRDGRMSFSLGLGRKKSVKR